MNTLKLFEATSNTEQEPQVPLKTFLEHTYRPFHPSLRPRTIEDYHQQVAKFSRWLGRPAVITDLNDDTMARYLADRINSGSPATASKIRSTLLALWRFAYQRRMADELPRDVPAIKAPVPTPKAWDQAELERLWAAAKAAKPIRPMKKELLLEKQHGIRWWGWDGRHWLALLMTDYDTSLRISSLIMTKTAQIDFKRRVLLTPATHQKDREWIEHRLHEQTVAAILETMPEPRELVFPWPRTPRQLWKDYTKILDSAGLPSSGRDKFHKIRRTSYTLIDALLGRQAATEHAGHSCDLSRHYLDRDLALRVSNKPAPVDVIPRPSSV